MQAYCESQHPGPLTRESMVQVSGWEATEALWPLNDMFRPCFEQIRCLSYDPRFELDADAAIEQMLQPGALDWSGNSPGAWRVLLERHQQAIMVALANEFAGNLLLPVPRSFNLKQRTVFVALFLLHSMELPFPVEDRSGFSIPQGALPINLRQH